MLAWTGEAIAVQSGLGSGFVGAVFLAIATSLPEITTSWTAVRLGRFGMAFRILVRPRRLILGMGLDSLSVLAVYGCGLLMLYVLR